MNEVSEHLFGTKIEAWEGLLVKGSAKLASCSPRVCDLAKTRSGLLPLSLDTTSQDSQLPKPQASNVWRRPCCMRIGPLALAVMA
jgi:hypothetical protein